MESYFMSIIYLTEMRDTEMMKTREEARRILRGQTGEQHGSSEKTWMPHRALEIAMGTVEYSNVGILLGIYRSTNRTYGS